METLTVIVCRVHDFATIEKIPHKLEEMQKTVGGWLECVRLDGTLEHGVDLWCDEEFLLKGCQPNREIRAPNYIGPLVIHGDFFLAAHDWEETVSLSAEEIERWLYKIDENMLAVRSKCTFCESTQVEPKDFSDIKSRKEFTISGMCQKCQDSFFEE